MSNTEPKFWRRLAAASALTVGASTRRQHLAGAARIGAADVQPRPPGKEIAQQV